jgi:hypothetical protein
MEWMAWLEETSLATWVRESPSLWAFPTVLTLHTFGLSLLVGANLVLALRMLGCARAIPLAPLTLLFPIMWTGFFLNAASGIVLFVPNATANAVQPVFIVKLGLVALGMINIYLLPPGVLSDPQSMPVRSRVFAITSMVVWAGAITTGRLMAYLKAS